MERIQGKFLEFIRNQIPILDTHLSEGNQPIHNRPMMSAMMFVKECMVSIDDKEIDDDFLVEDWFAEILQVTTSWYRERFGNEMLESPPDEILGVVGAFGTPLSLRIPRISEIETDTPAIKRIVFADGVLAEEDAMKWVSPAPNLSGLEDAIADAVRENVARNVTALRRIYRRTTVADYASQENRSLAESVEGHVAKAAADIQSNNFGQAIWELHLGIEKILKVYLRQANGKSPFIHDLPTLIADAEAAGLPSCAHLNLHTLPPEKDAIKHRYADLPAPNFTDMMKIYETAISAIADIAGSLTPGSFAAYGDLYIKALPWSAKWKRTQTANGEE